MIKYSNYQIIESNRLIMRFLNNDDFLSVYALQSNETNRKYLNRSKMASKEEAKKFIKDKNNGIAENKYLYWGICLKSIDEVIGTICLWSFKENPWRAEVGYELLPKFQRRGIMNEALNTLIGFGFNVLSLKRLEACVHENNEPSIHLLKKNNFSFVRVLSTEEKEESEQNEELLILALENKKDIK